MVLMKTLSQGCLSLHSRRNRFFLEYLWTESSGVGFLKVQAIPCGSSASKTGMGRSSPQPQGLLSDLSWKMILNTPSLATHMLSLENHRIIKAGKVLEDH